jgi:hypothetical protein
VGAVSVVVGIVTALAVLRRPGSTAPVEPATDPEPVPYLATDPELELERQAA